MPGRLQLELMEQTTAKRIDDLCNLSRRQMTTQELCGKDDYTEDGVNEKIEYLS